MKIEAGTNDLIVLPIILILIAVGQPEGRDTGQWAVFLVQLLITGPAVGGLIGALGALLVKRMDARLTIRTEHQALSGIGIMLLAYTAATSVGGDGFLAAFAAGLAVSLSNRRLCNSFMQYGEVTSENGHALCLRPLRRHPIFYAAYNERNAVPGPRRHSYIRHSPVGLEHRPSPHSDELQSQRAS